MESEMIVPGVRARYPATGTSGTVVRLEEIEGRAFAEIDSTGLLYRTDRLVLVEGSERPKGKHERSAESLDDYRHLKEIESSDDLRERYDDVTGVGAG
ncbi:hypothetical protein AZH53_10455 [Methanomicrobiaceae archaeon CYW5]|uniref:DUF2098 family protein n=1 Tax=Methanovulcanius yangii TaxID=1789227 RepID=UPI0029CA6155|nr:DUF2098 family protein [Methanovulcanius yangii]MBT8508826.1 hypothetical protein [Methanovulcanius yangii]